MDERGGSGRDLLPMAVLLLAGGLAIVAVPGLWSPLGTAVVAWAIACALGVALGKADHRAD